MKKIVGILILTIICIAATLLVFEFALRQGVTYVTHKNIETSGGRLEASPEFLIETTASGERRLVKNADVVIHNHYFSGRDVNVKTNSLGFRDDPIGGKEQDEYRVLVLGDSITIGDYLDAEEVYVEVLERMLREALFDRHRSVEVINAGIGNIGIEEEISILKDPGLSTKPDLVVLSFYLNDSRPPWGFSGEIGEPNWLRKHSLLFETIYRRFAESRWKKTQGKIRFQWIEDQKSLDWKNSRDEFLKLADAARFDWGAAWDDSSWNQVDNYLQELSQLSQQHGFAVALVAFPVSFQVEASFVEDTPQQKLATLASRYSFAYLDLLPTLREHSSENLFYDHCHPTVAGGRIIARALRDFLLKEISPEEAETTHD